MKKYFLAATILFFIGKNLQAQQLPIFASMSANRYFTNPAIVGAATQASVDAVFRRQWISIKGAPQTFAIGFQTPIPRFKIGLGGYLFNDKTGPLSRQGLQLCYSYHIATISDYVLSIGLNTTFTQFAVDKSMLYDALSTDQVIAGHPSAFSFDGGTGIYFHNNKFNIGFSTAQLFQAKLKISDLSGTNEEAQNFRHYFFTGGYNVKLTPLLYLRNNVLVRGASHTKMQAEFASTLLYKNLVWAQLGFRTTPNIITGFGLFLKKQFKVGYIYETPNLNPKSLPGFSHEIYLAYVFAVKPYVKPEKIDQPVDVQTTTPEQPKPQEEKEEDDEKK